MHAVRKPSPIAGRQQETAGFRHRETQSPEQSASATSGTYFRAVRPTAAEAAATAHGEPVIDAARVEGIHFELEVGVWRCDPERVAQAIIDEADFIADGVDAE